MSRAELDFLAAVARDAGRVIMQHYSTEFRVDYKGPGDPVTDADRAANTLICERLRAQFPDAAIVAEESPPEAYRGYRERQRVFFVDPLDGTREFVAKNGEFVVMIGLLIADQVTLGVIYAPATNRLWCGETGVGAYRVEADGTERPLRVGNVVEPEQVRIAISRSRRGEPLNRALSRISPRVVTPRGSAGLKGALVADDEADAYLAIGGAGKHWDSCALEALVVAAGGAVTDAYGHALQYRAEGLELEHGLLVTNPGLQRVLLPLLVEPATPA
ncbi:MAG TPA: 3'(2'),5'-bisphosphate nucleotidase CysQ [Polyangiaceae bacterium]|nr:3'(2'),5'-bisphosphate nucleotidase CysQ [Polyangiaceae bacterium]